MSRQYQMNDYDLSMLLKRCQELEKRGYECIKQIQKVGHKYTRVYAKSQ